jgi:hypothetical protein
MYVRKYLYTYTYIALDIDKQVSNFVRVNKGKNSVFDS